MTVLALAPEEWQSAAWTILVAAMANAACAVVGCYLLLRRQCLLGDAISHAVLPGIALAFMLTGTVAPLPMFLGAMALGAVTAIASQVLEKGARMPADASMGVVFTALFAAGVLMITRAAPNVHLDPGCVLYGLIEFVSLDMRSIGGLEFPAAMLPVGAALLATLAFVLLLWKELKIVSFDPGLATTVGVSAGVMHYALMALTAGVTVASFESVGSILVVAMLIVPAATAHLLTDRLGPMLVWSAAVGVASAIAGYVCDYLLNTGMAGATAVAAGGMFALAVFFSPRHGIVAQGWRRFTMALRIHGEDIVASLYRWEERSEKQPSVLTIPASSGLAKWALRKVRRQGLIVQADGGGLALTPAGRQAGESIVRAHRLWEGYLGAHFDLPLDHLHEPAEKIEHFIGPELQAQLERELQNPGVDPHGRPIPRQDGG